MSSQIQIVKEKLNSAISQLCETSWMFVKDPSRDFTRERKLPLHKVISILLCMEGGSLTGELLRYFGCSQQTASSSAFIQQRQKINEFALSGFFNPLTCHALLLKKCIPHGMHSLIIGLPLGPMPLT